MARFGGGFEASTIFILILLTVVGLYLFSQFTQKSSTTGDIEFKYPTEIDKTTTTVMKIILLGGIAAGLFYMFLKIGKGSLTRIDVATILITLVVVWFLWDWIIVKVLNADTLDDIATKTALKLGLG